MLLDPTHGWIEKCDNNFIIRVVMMDARLKHKEVCKSLLGPWLVRSFYHGKAEKVDPNIGKDRQECQFKPQMTG